ncbi:MAG: hypothetical protein OEW19_08990 [Acidobacteriota bacterium]|nr:hypothetical protein [Acidobacteriota bacterium]
MTRTICILGMLLLPGVAGAGHDDAACSGLEPAVLRFNAGEREQAYPELRALASQACPDPVVYLYAGVVERERRELTVAATTLKRGLQHAPASPQLWTELAVTYSWDDRLSDALDAYREALRLDPFSTSARLGEARVLAWLGQRNAAMARFEAVLDSEPANLEALNGLASVHVLSLRPDAARDYYARVLALAPGNQEARDGLRQAEAVRRVEVSVGLGAMSRPGSALRSVGLMATYRVTPELRVTGGYDTSARDPLREPLPRWPAEIGASVVPFGWHAGAEWRATRASIIGITVQSRRFAGDTTSSFGVNLSRRLNRTLVVLGGLQPGRSSTGGAWTLGSAGLSVATSRSTSVVVQGFRGTGRRGTSSALSLTGTVQGWRRSAVRTSIARGSEHGPAFTSLSAQVAWPLTPAAEFRLDGNWYSGAFHTRCVAVTVTTRF